MNEFNQIRDAYQKNLFATAGTETDILSLYRALPDTDVTGDAEEDLYHLAARFADADAVNFLQEKGIKPRSDKYGNTALHALTNTRFDFGSANVEQQSAAIYATAQALLNAGVNGKKKNDSGKLAYYEAGLKYMYSFIEAMGDAGVKMDATAEEGKNLLHTICDKLVHRKTLPGAVDAATKTVAALLEKGQIDPEDQDIFNSTPLTYAQRSGVKEIAALLSGEESGSVTVGMSIHEAVLNRDTAAVEALIASGTDLDEFSDQYRRTPLMLACEYPSLPMVELLVKGGADVNYTSGNEETAVLFLITKAVSNFGRGMSRDLKDVIKMLRKLVDGGLNINAPANADRDTALHLVCQAGYLADLNLNLAEEIIESGADVNTTNHDGQTALMAFCAQGDETKFALAELLLDNGADTTYVDKRGNTALIYAAGNGNKMSAKRMVGLLLDQDTSTIEKANNAGQTALDLAVQRDNEAVVKQILTSTE